jgi:hypothetical protein
LLGKVLSEDRVDTGHSLVKVALFFFSEIQLGFGDLSEVAQEVQKGKDSPSGRVVRFKFLQSKSDL